MIGRISRTPDPQGSFQRAWTSGGHHTYQENLGFRMSLPTVPTNWRHPSEGPFLSHLRSGSHRVFSCDKFLLPGALAPTCLPLHLPNVLQSSSGNGASPVSLYFFYVDFFSLELAQVCQGRGSFCLMVTLCLEQPLARSRCSVNTFQMHQHTQGWEWGGLEPVVGCQSCPGTLLCPPLRQDLFSRVCE